MGLLSFQALSDGELLTACFMQKEWQKEAARSTHTWSSPRLHSEEQQGQDLEPERALLTTRLHSPSVSVSRVDETQPWPSRGTEPQKETEKVAHALGPTPFPDPHWRTTLWTECAGDIRSQSVGWLGPSFQKRHKTEAALVPLFMIREWSPRIPALDRRGGGRGGVCALRPAAYQAEFAKCFPALKEPLEHGRRCKMEIEVSLQATVQG
ncbi:uncharacterized protein LOC116572840 [Mustela erminea]|uniref:uncharacterized protein LOC116572840 n=1 Tax=Mustela erminea TaxID=36723 RepID=UPI00138688AE|nr:uncharacterized protein LOC116572840 [Mustela erminea]